MVLRAVVRLQLPDRISTKNVLLLVAHYGQESRDFEQDTLHMIDEINFVLFLEIVQHALRGEDQPRFKVNYLQQEYEVCSTTRVHSLVTELALRPDAQFDHMQYKSFKQALDVAGEDLDNVLIWTS